MTDGVATGFQVDLSNCDREPIHIPGAIQPHGVLLVVGEPDLRILQASDNTGALLGAEPEALLGSPLDSLLSEAETERVRQLLTGNLQGASLLRIATRAGGGSRQWDGIFHRSAAGLVVELEPATADEPHSVSAFAAVRQSLARLQKARTLRALCGAMAEEIRGVTGLDRVTVYRFDAEWNGEVIAEARAPEMTPFLGLHFPASDIPQQARELYRRNWLRLIADVDYTPAAILPALSPVTGEPLDLGGSVLRSVSPIHLEYLRNMGVGASMSVSLLRNGELWGLIACHHAKPLHVPYEVRIACEFLGQTFSVQLGAVAEDEDRLRTLEIAATGATLLDRMAGADDWIGVLSRDTNPLLELVDAAGVAVRWGGEWVRAGQAPEPATLTELASWLGSQPGDVFQTDRLAELFPAMSEHAVISSGVLAAALRPRVGDYLLWFRPEVVQTVHWAGNPEKAVQEESDGGRLHPRASFQAWRETVRGRSLPWQPAEIRAATELRSRILDIVVRGAERLAQLNEELRRSNEELDSFTYIASHDLKEPLRGIHNYATMLLEEAGGTLAEGAASRIQTMLRLTRRMDAMFDSLLTYSRVGKLELNQVEADLQQLLDDVLDTLEVRVAESGTEIRVPRPLPTMPCDPVRTAAIFQNLITNALKYNDKPERWVEVGVRERDGGPGCVLRAGQRHRHPGKALVDHFSGFSAFAWEGQVRWWCRGRADDRQKAGAKAWRQDLAGIGPRRGQHLLLHSAKLSTRCPPGFRRR